MNIDTIPRTNPRIVMGIMEPRIYMGFESGDAHVQ